MKDTLRQDFIALHHDAEARLYRLRLLRDLGDPGFDPLDEDAVRDEMEELWYSMAIEERRILEAERAVRHARGSIPSSRTESRQLVDVEVDDHVRRGLPLMREAS